MVKQKEKVIRCKRCVQNGTIGNEEPGDRVVHHGFNTTVKDGRKQRYKCQVCGHTFYDDNDNER